MAKTEGRSPGRGSQRGEPVSAAADAEVGRALEHGSLSTLAAVLMLLEVLRRRALAMAPALVADVEYIVSLLDSELAELRALVGRLDKSRTAR